MSVLLDLIVDIPTEFLPVRAEKSFRTVISQPGLRYSQAEALVRQLLLDREFQSISAVERAAILERILNEIRGRMMEEIVLLETKFRFGKITKKAVIYRGEDTEDAGVSYLNVENYLRGLGT